MRGLLVALQDRKESPKKATASTAPSPYRTKDLQMRELSCVRYCATCGRFPWTKATARKRRRYGVFARSLRSLSSGTLLRLSTLSYRLALGEVGRPRFLVSSARACPSCPLRGCSLLGSPETHDNRGCYSENL